jgi:hypothetical protein
VDEDTYTAEEGMTWSEFVNSEYNTTGFYEEDWMAGTAIYHPSLRPAYLKEGSGDSTGTTVANTDVIKAGATYYKNTTKIPLPV